MRDLTLAQSMQRKYTLHSNNDIKLFRVCSVVNEYSVSRNGLLSGLNSSSQKPFVVHGTEGFEPRRADDEFSTHFLIRQYNSQLFEAMINLIRGPLEE